MRKVFAVCLILSILSFKSDKTKTITQKDVLEKLELANNYFMKKWPDAGEIIVTNKKRPSNIWTRAVYYEGLMALYNIDPKKEYYKYALDWGEFHKWKFRSPDIHSSLTYTRDADHLCAAQTYLELYLLDPKPEKIINARLAVDSIINTSKKDDWSWIDAIQMAMPVFAKLGVIYKDDKYFDKMHEMYLTSKNEIGGGLYNQDEHLWWRDADFTPPYKEPNGENCYWSRGNGWVYTALARVLDVLPEDNKYRAEYLETFKEMSYAILKVQRPDGFWNVSLHDPTNYGGKELTGTAFFAYGFAWGINNNVLTKKKFAEPMLKAWKAISEEGLHSSGFLGYVQGTGKEPKDGQPVTYTSKPDFEDYGLGAFLLAGTELYKYLRKEQNGIAAKSKLSKYLETIFYNPSFAKINKTFYSANDFGAVGDGITDNTKYIQKTIDQAAEKGGGIVSFKPGIYMTSSLFVKSNIEFRIDEGVVLRAIQDDALYPEIDTRIAGVEMKWPAALINVKGQENVRITGKGIIDGNGEYWWKKYWGNGLSDMGGMRKTYEEQNLRWVVDYDCKRVRALVVDNSKNVLLKDFTIKRSGFWTVTLLYSQRCHVDGVIIRNNIGTFGPSSDGINTDSSSDILVENCDVDCNDDNFCIKSGRDADGLRVNIPAKNVVYRNSIARSGHGLFSIGSETSGGMENIEAYNLSSYGTLTGLRLKSAKVRGGVMQNIYIHDIEMTDTKRPFQFEMNWYSNYSLANLPDSIDLNQKPEHWRKLLEPVVPAEKGIPEFKNVVISNITATGAERALYAAANEEKKMDNFTWENIYIEATEAGSLKYVSNWKMKNVETIAEDKVLILSGCEGVEIPKGLVAKTID